MEERSKQRRGENRNTLKKIKRRMERDRNSEKSLKNMPGNLSIL